MGLRDEFERVALAIRRELAECNAGSYFNFHVTANGRVQGSLEQSEVKITFGLGEFGPSVNGNSHEAVLEEYIRRNGWERRHAPLALAPPVSEPSPAPVQYDSPIAYDTTQPPPEVPGDASDSENLGAGMPVSEHMDE